MALKGACLIQQSLPPFAMKDLILEMQQLQNTVVADAAALDLTLRLRCK
jgi:hypothetical protein